MFATEIGRDRHITTHNTISSFPGAREVAGAAREAEVGTLETRRGRIKGALTTLLVTRKRWPKS